MTRINKLTLKCERCGAGFTSLYPKKYCKPKCATKSLSEQKQGITRDCKVELTNEELRTLVARICLGLAGADQKLAAEIFKRATSGPGGTSGKNKEPTIGQLRKVATRG